MTQAHGGYVGKRERKSVAGPVACAEVHVDAADGGWSSFYGMVEAERVSQVLDALTDAMRPGPFRPIRRVPACPHSAAVAGDLGSKLCAWCGMEMRA